MRYAILAATLYLVPQASAAVPAAAARSHATRLPGAALCMMLLGCALVTGGQASHRRFAPRVLS